MRFQDSVTLHADSGATPTLQIFNIVCETPAPGGKVQLFVFSDLTTPQALSITTDPGSFQIILKIGQDSSGVPTSTPADIIAAIAANPAVSAMITAVALDTLPPTDGDNEYSLGYSGTPVTCPGPFQDSIFLNNGDVGGSNLTNIPCEKVYGGVVTVIFNEDGVTPQAFALSVSGNTVTITEGQDSDGIPTTPLSTIAAAIAANPAAAALLTLPITEDVLPENGSLTMTLGLDDGVTVSCGPVGPFSYAY